MALIPCVIENLCEHCILVRIDAAGVFPAPYKFSVTFVRTRFADLPGEFMLAVGHDHKDISPREFESAIRKVNQATGLLVAYWRAADPPERHVQIEPGLIRGRILMSKDRKPHHVKSAVHNGEVDHTAVAAEMRHVADLLDAGKIKLRNPDQVALADGWDRIQFDRKLDPSLHD